jgi:hypothetical protein
MGNRIAQILVERLQPDEKIDGKYIPAFYCQHEHVVAAEQVSVKPFIRPFYQPSVR